MYRADGQTIQELVDYLGSSKIGKKISCEKHNYELTITCAAADIVEILQFLRDDPACLFKQLMDVCGADYPSRPQRFEVLYHLLSLRINQRVRVRVLCGEGDPVPSVVGVYSSAGWFEREAWDMYGIMFSGNPDLRRILTDYGFEGHPLRKDFPLTGYVEVRYDNQRREVVYEPVNLVQEFRNFDYMSPWEGAKYILPGDEKAGEKK